jgi:hypothetical protein
LIYWFMSRKKRNVLKMTISLKFKLNYARLILDSKLLNQNLQNKPEPGLFDQNLGQCQCLAQCFCYQQTSDKLQINVWDWAEPVLGFSLQNYHFQVFL